MIELQALVEIWRTSMLALLLVFARVGTVAMFLPPLSERSVPTRIRLVLGFALSIVVMPSVQPMVAAADPAALPRLFLAEAVCGISLGVLLRLAVTALQICGTIVAQVTSLAQLFGGVGMEPLPVIGHLLVMSGLVLAMMADLHVRLAVALIESYRILDFGHLPLAGALAETIVSRVAGLFSLAFSLAAPFVIAALLYNIALGVINRAMPQLMVILIGAPAIIAATLALLAATTPFLLEAWFAAFARVLADPLGAF